MGHSAKTQEDLLDARKELVRLGERHIDAQLRASEEQDTKSRHLMTMAGATLIAASAIGGLATQTEGWKEVSTMLRLPFALAIGLSFVFTGRAFVVFSRSYVGGQREPMQWQTGWKPETIRQASEEEDSKQAVVTSTAWGFPNWAANNSKLLIESYKMRRTGTTALTWAGGFLASALIYALLVF